MAEKGRCEFCGKEDIYVQSTPSLDTYCEDCMELAIGDAKEALKELRAANRTKKKKKLDSNDLEALRAEKDAALARLIGDSKIYGKNPFDEDGDGE